MKNHSLDANQCIENSYSRLTESLKNASNYSQSGSLTETSDLDVIAEFDCSQFKEFLLLVKSESVIAVAKNLTIEISPVESGDVWVATSTVVATPLTAVFASIPSILSTIAKRVRVVASGNLGAGESASVYLICR